MNFQLKTFGLHHFYVLFLFYNGIRRINHEEFKKVESEKELFSIWVKIMKLLNAANHKGASDN